MQSNARLEKNPQYDYVMKTDDKEIVMTKCTDEKDLGDSYVLTNIYIYLQQKQIECLA